MIKDFLGREVDRKTSVLNNFETRACKVEYTEGK